MKIPEAVVAAFYKEAEGLQFGKVSLGLVMRGGHVHYEIDKHITLAQDKDRETEYADKGENGAESVNPAQGF
jgi:hypothetical protein